MSKGPIAMYWMFDSLDVWGFLQMMPGQASMWFLIYSFLL